MKPGLIQSLIVKFRKYRRRVWIRRYLLTAQKYDEFVIIYFEDFGHVDKLVLSMEWKHTRFYQIGMKILWLNKGDDIQTYVKAARETLYK